MESGESRTRARLTDVLALLLLGFGGFLFVVGWAIGLYLLVRGPRWKPWEKVLGALVFPVGVPGALVLSLTVLPCAPVTSIVDGRTVATTCPDQPVWLAPTLSYTALAIEFMVLLFLLVQAWKRAPARVSGKEAEPA